MSDSPSVTVRLFNPLTQNSGDVPVDKVKSALDMGAQLAQPTVRLYNPDTEKDGDVPSDKVPDALKMGAHIVGSHDHKIATTDYGTSAIRGAIQGATFGFGDELGGGLKGLYDTATKGGDLSDNYTKARDEIRTNDALASEANPKTFIAGQVGGGLATSLATGGAAGELGLAGRLGLGAAEGALNGLGASNAADVEGNLKDAAVGGGLGLVGSGLGEAVGAAGKKLFGKAAAALEPEEQYALALGANAKEMDPIRGAQFQKAIEHLSDSKYFPTSASTEDLYKKIVDDKAILGDSIGTIYKNAEKDAPLLAPSVHESPISPAVQKKLNQLIDDAPLGERAGLANDVKDLVSKTDRAQGSVEDLWRVRKVIDKQVDLKKGWDKHLNPAAIEIRQEIRGALKDHLNGIVHELSQSNPDKYSNLAVLNKNYSALETVDDALARKFGREGANASPLGLKYRAALSGALGAGALGHPALGLPIALAQHAASGTRGQLAAAALGKVMPAIGDAAQAAGPVLQDTGRAVTNTVVQQQAAPPPPPPPPVDPSVAIRAKLQQLPIAQRAKALSAYNSTGVVPPGLMGPPSSPPTPPNFSQFVSRMRQQPFGAQ